MKNKLSVLARNFMLVRSFFKKSELILTWAVLFIFVISGCDKLQIPQSVIQMSSISTELSLRVSPKILQAVNLGSAISFTILTETGITTTGITNITGDIGTSPIASTAMTGFGLIMSSDQSSAKSSLVTSGMAYAPDYLLTTPAKMVNAITDMESAFNSGNALTPTRPIDSYAGDISGQYLIPGVYKWSAGLLLSNGSTVVLTGSPTDVYVFQIGSTLTIGSNSMVNLGKVLPANVFWIVGSAATFGTDANFGGIILAKTLISLNTGDTVNGRLFAQTAVTMIANTVIGPPVLKSNETIGQNLATMPVLFESSGMSITSSGTTYYISESSGQYLIQGRSKNNSGHIRVHNAGNARVVIENADNHTVMTIGSSASGIPYLYGQNIDNGTLSTFRNMFTITAHGKGQYTLQDTDENYVELSADLKTLTLRSSGHANELDIATVGFNPLLF